MAEFLTLNFIKDIIQILLLSFIVYKLYSLIAVINTNQVVLSLVYYISFYLLCDFFKLDVILFILRKTFIPISAFLCIVYHAEFKRSISAMFSGKAFRLLKDDKTTLAAVETVLNSVETLVAAKRGAIIVFPRQMDLKNIIDTGTKLNADISTSLISSIFVHDTALHDGGIIIAGGRIVAAACYLPLSSQVNIQQSFGSRHRAALGLCETSDAVVLVVSEENGSVSLAYNSSIHYDLDYPLIKKQLLTLLNYYPSSGAPTKEDEGEE